MLLGAKKKKIFSNEIIFYELSSFLQFTFQYTSVNFSQIPF